MRAAFERNDWDEVGRQIAIEWENRRRLAPGVSTPAIDDLIARARAAGATAAKVCGAGGGGCLFCYGPPDARDRIAAALTAGGAKVLEYRIDMEGLRLGSIFPQALADAPPAQTYTLLSMQRQFVASTAATSLGTPPSRFNP